MMQNVIIKGIDFRDYPDFSDAYIESATIDGKQLREDQLEEVNEDVILVYELVLNHLG